MQYIIFMKNFQSFNMSPYLLIPLFIKELFIVGKLKNS